LCFTHGNLPIKDEIILGEVAIYLPVVVFGTVVNSKVGNLTGATNRYNDDDHDDNDDDERRIILINFFHLPQVGLGNLITCQLYFKHTAFLNIVSLLGYFFLRS